MNVFGKIAENKHLCFVDENNPNRELTLENITAYAIEEEEKKLVFLYLDNSISSVSVFFSVLKSKHACLLLSLELDEQFKTDLEKRYTPAYIYDAKRASIPGYNKTTLFFEKDGPQKQFIHPDIKLLLSTSGTTGSPKFVKLSDTNLLSNAISISSYLPITSTDVTPLNLPIYYSYGLSVLLSNALKGGKIMCGQIDVLNRTFWDNLERFGYTSIAGVPFVYEMLDRIGFTKKKYTSLNYFTQAGGKLQDKLVKKFADFAEQENLLFYVMYGQTEATARMAYLPPENLQEKIGSIGKAIPYGKLFIDETNAEICYEGANVFGGYVSELADLEHFERQQVLHTGDLGKQDAEGFFFVTGRLKRFIKLFGTRINLDELESLLAKTFDVDCKCAGDQDKKLIVVSDHLRGKENELKNYLVEKIKIHPSVIFIKEIDELPLTVNGKVNYNELLLKYVN